MTAVTWTATETDHPARTASRRSISAVTRGARDSSCPAFPVVANMALRLA